MPLSEHERKILSSLEESLQNDARFSSRVGHVRLSSRRRQTRVVSVVGFVLGTTVMVTYYTRSVATGILGVAMMVASALYFVSTLSRADHFVEE
ncbi:MAG: DUF3040 domain-containing protein [Acidobacteria bacterium]|nr:DUF3040 domain-containing protein [Acidobacteriota bacterium]